MANRLANEKSPYLLQHAHNPVDWYPWGPEALERARREDRPILVSIGYSACHWCHVMERESFEDPATAEVMNERLVNIKVDREERPDVDAIYMEAVQAMSGQGGWPLNVFLTPDGRPYYGGTYFPPTPRHGMPGWSQVVATVADAYRERREDVLHNAGALEDYIRRAQSPEAGGASLSPGILEAACSSMLREADPVNGGFGTQPKFPQPLALELLLRLWRRFGREGALSHFQLTLDRMATGGIFDQLGGGFHRYTVDGEWVVPHFEKMLYDNALLARVYLQAYQATGEPRYRLVVERTLDYLLREMRDENGGFYSAEDADSEGEEGKFYVWTPHELRGVLGDESDLAETFFGVTEQGNFEGKTILTNAATIEDAAAASRLDLGDARSRLEEQISALLVARDRRVHPGKDTKIVCGWNALAIGALAEAGRVLDRPEYLEAAERAAGFILKEMRPGGKLVRSYLDGPGSVTAFLEDYAYLAEALVTLYETTFDPAYYTAAVELTREMIDLFGDPEGGAFYDARAGQDDLIVRPRSLFDNPIPSGNAAGALALLRLEAISGEGQYADLATRPFEAVSGVLARAPLGFAYLLCGLDFYLSTPLQVAIVRGQDLESLRDEVFRRYLPNRVVAVGEPGEVPLLADRTSIGGKATAYVCERFVCRLPVTEPAALGRQLDSTEHMG